MLYREVPKNGDKLSVLGYGCLRLPVRKHSINEKLAEKQISYALEQGVNYFDTAYPYHSKKSEPFLDKVLSKNNDGVLDIKTKRLISLAVAVPRQKHTKERCGWRLTS